MGYLNKSVDENGRTMFTTAKEVNGRPVTEVELTGSLTEQITFHNAATEPAQGAIFDVGTYKTLTISIRGTSTSRTVEFKTLEYDGYARTIAGIKLDDFSISTKATENNGIWQFDVSGLEQVVMDLTSVSGGSVFVKGKAVM